MRNSIATLAFILATLSGLWLLLGMLEIVPLVFQIPGGSTVRTHASITVTCLLLASWGFWESD
ncbi:MAG: hypothetical protein ACI9QV_000064 [Methylophagaceae bacterium]|jgi:hypothetical protein